MLRQICAWTGLALLFAWGSFVVADEVFVPLRAKDKSGEVPRDLNPPIDINTKVGDPTKQSVFIYYANETAPNADARKNYDQIIAWLRATDDKELLKIVGQLKNDLAAFPRAVDKELASIERNLTEGKGKHNVSVVVFTNRLAHEGKFRMWRRGATAFEDTAIAIPKYQSVIYASSPLATEGVFHSALQAVAKQFDTAKHDFVLVTKSHGNLSVAMTPRLIVDVSETTRDELIALAKGTKNKNVRAVLPKEELPKQNSPKKELGSKQDVPKEELGGTQDLSVDDYSLIEWRVNKPGGHGDLEATNENERIRRDGRVGVTKSQYVATLQAVTRETGMRIPLLFVEACRSQLEGVELVKLRQESEKIGRVYTSDLNGLQFTTIDYDEVFRRCTATVSFADAVHQTLFRKYEEQKTAREKVLGIPKKTETPNDP